MLKFDLKAVSFLFLFVLLTGFTASAMDENEGTDESEWESKARQAHKVAASDMMYQNEEWKALYYQNQQIIQLLKQVRDSLEVIKLHGNKENSEEKSG